MERPLSYVGTHAPGPTLPARVTIREVGPRDGLQAEKPLPIDDRAALIEALSQTGVPKVCPVRSRVAACSHESGDNPGK